MSRKQPGLILYFDDIAAWRNTMSPQEFYDFFFTLADYAQHGQQPANMPPVCQLAFELVRGKVDRDIAKYAAKVAQTSEAGKRSAAIRARLKALFNSTNVDKLENQAETQAETSLSHPTLEQVKEFAARMGFDVDVNRWYLLMNVTGWTDGQHMPIRNWQMYFTNWALSHQQTTINHTTHADTWTNIQQREYTQADYNALFTDLSEFATT